MASLRRWLAAALALGALAGCDTDDGRTLEPPPPGATAPPMPTSSTTTPVADEPPAVSDTGALLVSSPAFGPGEAIPQRFASCGGENVSPPLAWEGVPPDAVELALVVVDPDAPGEPFVHWVVAGIDPVVLGFGEGGLPEGAADVVPWTGPCPPEGEVHAYEFTLYALGSPAAIDAETDLAAARAAIDSGAIATGTLTATYGRPG